LERKFLKYSFSWYDSFIGTKVLGTFAPEERKFHRSESSKERMFHGTKVPPERKFSLWSFRSRERKCRGTNRPGIIFLTTPKHVTFLFAFSSRYAFLFCVFFQICQNVNIKLSQGSVATHWRYGGKYYMDFVGNYFSFQQWKNFQNPLRINKVIHMSLLYYFFGTQCSMCINKYAPPLLHTNHILTNFFYTK